jgi:1,4-alpha-glucan branching enzyme
MTAIDYSKATDGTRIISVDPWLEPFADALKSRYALYEKWNKTIEENEGGLEKFALGFNKMGFQIDEKSGGITYREYAPGVVQAFLIGDFNSWNRDSHPMKRDPFGTWSIELPGKGGKFAIEHGSKVKISMIKPNGERIERLPAWIK